MRIIVDAFGGDHAPLAPIDGAAQAVKEYGVNIVLTGNEAEIRDVAAKNNISLDGIEIIDTPVVMPVDADPSLIRTEYKDSSLAVGLKELADKKVDAYVSAGSTGAILMGATFIVKRLKGVKRPALGATVPIGNNKYYLLMDCGANSECRPEMLLQFGIMGSVYAENVMGIASPRVGLVNVGAEPTKGMPLQVESYHLLSKAPINFIGNIEARDIPTGGCDVAIADGFTGNIVLKLSEGFSSFISQLLKSLFMQNSLTKMSYLALKKPIEMMRKSMDYKGVGGAPILGVAAPVVKAHGSSNAFAIKNAIRQAIFFVEKDVCNKVEIGVAKAAEMGE